MQLHVWQGLSICAAAVLNPYKHSLVTKPVHQQVQLMVNTTALRLGCMNSILLLLAILGRVYSLLMCAKRRGNQWNPGLHDRIDGLMNRQTV